MIENIIIWSEYVPFLQEIKSTIRSTQLQSFRKVNHDLIMLYFRIGKMIANKQQQWWWWAKIIDQLSCDLIQEFGKWSGYSVRNLKYMFKFFEAYKDFPIVQWVVAQLPRWQNIEIMDKCSSIEEKKRYAELVIQKWLSRSVLVHQIEWGAFAISQQVVQNNFDITMPEASDMAKDIIKDEYVFNFLGLQEPFAERELEKWLIDNIKQFLLELGSDFCFMGNQYKLVLGENEYFIDLLFYHRTLKRLFAIELKTQKFQPEFVGKMNFYLEVLDETIRKEGEGESIGIILCKNKDNLIVEYALRTSPKPIAIATYQITKQLTEKLQQLDLLRTNN